MATQTPKQFPTRKCIFNKLLCWKICHVLKVHTLGLEGYHVSCFADSYCREMLAASADMIRCVVNRNDLRVCVTYFKEKKCLRKITRGPEIFEFIFQ